MNYKKIQMRTTTRLSILSIILSITFSCVSNKKLAEQNSIITPLADKVTLTDGSIVYGLPRTVFTVFVEMERTIEKPGPYARFAGDLLGMNNVIQNQNEYWSISGISVKTHDELDPSEFYVIESNTLFQTNVLVLKKEGLILDLNPGLIYPAENKIGIKETEFNQFRSLDLGSDEYFLQQSDTAFRRVNIDSSFVRIPYIVEKKKRLTTEQLAEKAARRLMEMRDGKHMILTGEANVFPQSDASLNEINRLEKEYTELFSGKTWKETMTYSYQIVPDKKMAGKTNVIFQFSELTGPVNGALKGGIPVTIEFVPEQKTKELTILSKNQPDQKVPEFDKLYYRVPDVVNIKISLGPEMLFNSRRLIYQFGEVIQLPANYIIGK
jgi:hypothetical protein